MTSEPGLLYQLSSSVPARVKDRFPIKSKGQGQHTTVLGHQCGLGQQSNPVISAWPLEVTQTSDINTDTGYNRNMDSDMAPAEP